MFRSPTSRNLKNQHSRVVASAWDQSNGRVKQSIMLRCCGTAARPCVRGCLGSARCDDCPLPLHKNSHPATRNETAVVKRCISLKSMKRLRSSPIPFPGVIHDHGGLSLPRVKMSSSRRIERICAHLAPQEKSLFQQLSKPVFFYGPPCWLWCIES